MYRCPDWLARVYVGLGVLFVLDVLLKVLG